MSEVAQMLQRYKEVRNRLRYPPNAVPDPEAKISKLQQVLLPPPCPVRRPPQPVASFRSPFLRKDITPCNVLASVAYDYGLTIPAIFSRNRKKPVCVARWVGFYLILKHCRISATDISKRLKMDHTSILHGIRKVKEMMSMSPEFAAKVEVIEENLLARFTPTTIPPFYK